MNTMDFSTQLYIFLYWFIIIHNLLFPAYGSMYKRDTLGSTFTDCPGFCQLIRIPEERARSYPQCAHVCDVDITCAFFRHEKSMANSCYICSLNANGYDGSNWISNSLPAVTADSIIYKRSSRFSNFGKCKQISSDCSGLQASGVIHSGVYGVFLDSGHLVEVYCDMQTDGGGWTVFQRRQGGSVSFERTWSEYESGFGDPSGEFWLGNQYIAALTAQGTYELRVDLIDQNGVEAFSEYASFSIDAADDYRANVGTFLTGNAGDGLRGGNQPINGMKFSTVDSENHFCAQTYGGGGWWFNGCFDTNLNGRYNNNTFGQGVIWVTFRYYDHSLQFSEMKLRKIN